MSVLSTADWYVQAKNYSGSGAWLDESGGGLDLQLGSGAGADSNDPLWLSHTGAHYVRLPGAADNFISTPHAAALDLTGDLEIEVLVDPTDWSDTTRRTLVVKTNGVLALPYTFRHSDTANRIELVWYDGAYKTALATADCGAGLKWYKVTREIDTGGGNWEVNFYSADDASGEPGTYAALGAAVTGTGSGTAASSSDALRIGSEGGASNNSNDAIYRVRIRDGIDGTLVADFDPNATWDATLTTLTGTGDGRTWTVGRSATGRKASVVTEPKFLCGTDDYFTRAVDDALFDPGTSPFSALAVFRGYDYTSSVRVLGKWDGTVGWSVAAASGVTSISGTTTDSELISQPGPAVTDGERLVVVATVDVWAGDTYVYTNGDVGAAKVGDLTGALATADALTAAELEGTYYDVELMALGYVDRYLSPGEAYALMAELA